MNAGLIRISAMAILLGGLEMPFKAHAQASEEGNPEPSIQKTIEEYCTSVSDLARERRAALQASALKELEAKVDDRLTLLEQKKQELDELIQKRTALRNLAEKELVDIYAGMDAEAAAAQMEKLDMRLASSVLRQLKPRQASAILDVMKPELAAGLVKLIAVAAADGKTGQ